MQEALGPLVAIANPLDYHTYIWADEAAMTACYSAALAAPVDAALLVSDYPVADRCDDTDWLAAERAFMQALGSISIGGIFTLTLVTQLVLQVEPWFSPRHTVPLAGMIFASSMNAVSLAADRFQAEIGRDVNYREARRIAFQTALIPIINSLFAVGVVALPGMMTGQILSGVSPLIAAQYQIVVMTMLFGASGISAASYLALQRH